MNMSIVTPIAFGVTMVVCIALFFYCWRIRKLRNRLTSVQVSATPEEVHIEETIGIRKDVVDRFPTVRTNELKIDVKEELQCPICLAEYGEAEVLRQLPSCGHVFHIRCVDSWLEKQITCPVCRIILTETSKPAQDANPQQNYYCRRPSTPGAVTVELAAGVPSWVLVNRPFPLPPAIPETSVVDNTSFSESSRLDIESRQPESLVATGEAPLLKPVDGDIGGWGAVYLEKSTNGLSFRSQNAEVAFESRDCTNTVSERWMAESFSFGISSFDDISSMGIAGSLDSPDTGKHSRSSSTNSQSNWKSNSGKSSRNNRDSRSSWSSRSTNSWDFSPYPAVKHWQKDFGYPPEEVMESPHHMPLTISPEHCSFEFLPIITGPGGDYSFRPPKPTDDRPRPVGSKRQTYSQL